MIDSTDHRNTFSNLSNGNKKPRAIHGGCLGDLRLYPVVPASDLTDRIPLKSISVTGRKFFWVKKTSFDLTLLSFCVCLIYMLSDALMAGIFFLPPNVAPLGTFT